MGLCGLPPRTDSSRGICLLVTIVQRTTNIKPWAISKEILVYPRSVFNTDREVPTQLHPKTVPLMTSPVFLHGRRQLHLNTFRSFIHDMTESCYWGTFYLLSSNVFCLLRWFLPPPPPFSPLPFLPAAVTVPPQCKYSGLLDLHPQQHFSVCDYSLEETILIAVEWWAESITTESTMVQTPSKDQEVDWNMVPMGIGCLVSRWTLGTALS